MLAETTMLVCLIVVDDLGSDLRNLAPTPQLDRIAADGVDFTNVWAAPSCSPFRAQLMTGRYPHRPESLIGRIINKKNGDEWRLPPSPELLPAAVNGWTSMNGKWHLSDLSSQSDHPADCGWDLWWGTNYNLGSDGTYYGGFCWDNGSPDVWSGYLTEVTAERAAAHLQSHDALVYVPLHAVHKPFEAPPAHLHSYGDLTGADELTIAKAMVEATDAIIGRLARVALEEGYVVIVTTDNGTSGIIGGAKGSFEERGLNTWMHVVGPGIQPGEDDSLICPTDLYATITHLTNGAPVLTEDAHSFYGNLFPGGVCEPTTRAYSFSCKFRPNGIVPDPTDEKAACAIRDERWKVIYGRGVTVEFYDLENDPEEQNNLLLTNDVPWEALERLNAEAWRIWS